MLLKLYGIGKTMSVIVNVMAIAVVAADPTVKVALIVAAPLLVANIGNFILGLLTRADNKAILRGNTVIQTGVDGINGRLQDKVNEQVSELSAQGKQIAHQQGRQDERDSAS